IYGLVSPTVAAQLGWKFEPGRHSGLKKSRQELDEDAGRDRVGPNRAAFVGSDHEFAQLTVVDPHPQAEHVRPCTEGDGGDPLREVELHDVRPLHHVSAARYRRSASVRYHRQRLCATAGDLLKGSVRAGSTR